MSRFEQLIKLSSNMSRTIAGLRALRKARAEGNLKVFKGLAKGINEKTPELLSVGNLSAEARVLSHAKKINMAYPHYGYLKSPEGKIHRKRIEERASKYQKKHNEVVKQRREVIKDIAKNEVAPKDKIRKAIIKKREAAARKAYTHPMYDTAKYRQFSPQTLEEKMEKKGPQLLLTTDHGWPRK
jgi:hypothetical protein